MMQSIFINWLRNSSKLLAFSIIMCVILSACTPNVIYVTKDVKKASTTKKTKKKSVTPLKGKEFYAVCSYYGRKFHGRKTANGETFDMHAMTCAHKRFAFGTKLKVTNESNGKSVIVRVNDRGPFIKGRDIDLSYGAADKIGLIPHGVLKCKVEVL